MNEVAKGLVEVEIYVNSPHVVFKSEKGNIFFSQKSSNNHIGLEIIREFPSLQQAADFCKELNAVNDKVD